MFITMAVQIGNSDDKLKRREWSRFVAQTASVICELSKQVHFSGGSSYNSIWQNSCWVFEIEEERIDKLEHQLRFLRHRYNQDSIAVLKGQTSFI